jgi:arylsulfatase A-like enzyme
MDFIEESALGEKPFFLYLAPTSLHGPHHAQDLLRDYDYTPEGRIEGLDAYAPDLEKLAAEIADMPSPRSHRYTGMRFLDHQAGMVMDKLEELGIAGNTVLIFLPDHNTEPGKSTCYEKGVKIPMVIKWPGKTKPGSRTAARVQTMDLLPTIVELVGGKVPEGYLLDGKSLTPVLEDPVKEVREYIFSESGYTRSVLDGNMKYIAFRYPDDILLGMKNGEYKKAPTHVATPGGIPVVNMAFYPAYWEPDQLFDLDRDPYEQHNLAADPAYAEKLAKLQEVLKEHLAGFDHPFDLSPQPFMQSEQFSELKNITARQKPEDIVWYVRDWGTITWPPEKGNGL